MYNLHSGYGETDKTGDGASGEGKNVGHVAVHRDTRPGACRRDGLSAQRGPESAPDPPKYYPSSSPKLRNVPSARHTLGTLYFGQVTLFIGHLRP